MRDNLTQEQKEFLQTYIFSMQNEIENLKLSNDTYKFTMENIIERQNLIENQINIALQHVNDALNKMYGTDAKIDNLLYSLQNTVNAVQQNRQAF